MRPARLWVVASGALVREADGHGKLFLTQVQDISPLRRAEESAHAAEVLFHSAFDHAPLGIGLLTLEGRWLQVNAAFTRMVGYTAEQLTCMSIRDLSEPSTRDADEKALAALAADHRRTYVVEKPFRHASGHLLWVRVSAYAVLGPDEKPSRLVSQYEDVSERRVADARLEHLALHDPLTGLANRALLMDRLDLALAKRARKGGQVMVVFCDLDDLKAINDRYGHATGDDVLLMMADALRDAVRPGDTVARIGGDEFVVAGATRDLAAAQQFVARLRAVTAAAGIATSIGLAISHYGEDATELLAAADRAMYVEKTRGNDARDGHGTPPFLRDHTTG